MTDMALRPVDFAGDIMSNGITFLSETIFLNDNGPAFRRFNALVWASLAVWEWRDQQAAILDGARAYRRLIRSYDCAFAEFDDWFLAAYERGDA